MTPSEVLEEIVQGFSEIAPGVYFKHPSIKDRLVLSKLEKTLFQRAKDLGLLTKEEALKKAFEKGWWTQELEAELEQSSWYLPKLKKSLEKASEFSLKRELESKIKDESAKLDSLVKRKRDSQGICAEDYVATRIPSMLCEKELFEDLTFSSKVDSEKIKGVVSLYLQKNSDLLERELLLKAVFSPNFFDLFFIYEKSDNIFGKNIYDLTVFQKELLGYGRVLYSKLTRIFNIPESIKNDPIKLYSYEEKDGKKEEVETNVRKMVEEKGGIENLRPEDKLT